MIFTQNDLIVFFSADTQKQRAYFKKCKNELVDGVRASTNSEKCKAIKNDDERIKFILNNLMPRFKYELSNQPIISSKCSKLSEKYRTAGIFQSQTKKRFSFHNAFELFTRSIALAPPGSPHLSFAYFNRSCVFMRARLLDDCLKDMENALNAGYPDKLKAKLFLQKAQCLQVLNRSDHAEYQAAMEETSKWLPKMNKNNRKLAKKLYDQQLNFQLPAEVIYYNWDFKDVPPHMMGGENLKIPGLSNAVELKYSDDFGRHCVATRDIEPGQILGVQKPYVDVVEWDMRHKLCWNCTCQVYASIPCDTCSDVVYCSKLCQQQAYVDYHDIECNILQKTLPFEQPNEFLVGLRLTIQALKESGNSVDDLRDKLKTIDAAGGKFKI